MVMREGSTPKEKARLVVNGAQQFHGTCFNAYLGAGPNLENDLTDILLLIRRHKYVLCCYMRNIFLNIMVAPSDRKFLRTFYRPSPEDEL